MPKREGGDARDLAERIGPENWTALEDVIREVFKRVGPRVLQWRVAWGIEPLIGLVVLHTCVVTAREMRLGELAEEIKAAEARRETLARVEGVLDRLYEKGHNQLSAVCEGAFDEAALMLEKALRGGGNV